MSNVAKSKSIHIQVWADPIQVADFVKFMKRMSIPSNRMSDIIRFALDLAYQHIKLPPIEFCKTESDALSFLKEHGLLREQNPRAVKAIIKTLVEEDRRVEQLQELIDSFSKPVPTSIEDIHLMAENPPETEEEK